MTQLALIQDTTIKKSIATVPITELKLSRFNPRLTRPDDDINKLAERISRNGFEITRALWAYRNGDGYEVFAGGTRLEAARRAGVKKVPVVLHEGLTDEDIVRLAYEDNENDEYHTEVPIVEIWADYARLRDEGWTQERIAEAVRVDQSFVSLRLKLNELSENIKSFMNQGVLEEAHLLEISKLLIDSYFSPWLTTEQARLELAKEAAKSKLTTRPTRELVARWKSFIALAESLYNQLDPDWQITFIKRLADNKARTEAQVQFEYNKIIEKQLEQARLKAIELARQRDEAEAERLRLEQEQAEQRRIQEILSNIHLGDFREVCKQFDSNSIDVILTDAPYKEQYIPLYEDLAIEAKRLLKPGGSLLVMCGQFYLPQYLALMTPHINYHWPIAYLTPGGQSPQIFPRKVNTFWKPVLWFVKGEYDSPWQGDVVESDVNDNDKKHHKWGQSESGIARLVEKFTQSNDLILDPFFGGGTVGAVALRLGRCFIGIDNAEDAISASKERIFKILQEQSHDQ